METQTSWRLILLILHKGMFVLDEGAINLKDVKSKTKITKSIRSDNILFKFAFPHAKQSLVLKNHSTNFTHKDQLKICLMNWGCGSFGSNETRYQVALWKVKDPLLRCIHCEHRFRNQSLSTSPNCARMLCYYTVNSIWRCSERYDTSGSLRVYFVPI